MKTTISVVVVVGMALLCLLAPGALARRIVNTEPTRLSMAPPPQQQQPRLNAGGRGKITIISNDNSLNQQQTVSAKDNRVAMEEEVRKKNVEENMKKTAAARAKLLHEETEKHKQLAGSHSEREEKARQAKKKIDDEKDREAKEAAARREAIEKLKNEQKQAAELERQKVEAAKREEEQRRQQKEQEDQKQRAEEERQKASVMSLVDPWMTYGHGYDEPSVEVWPPADKGVEATTQLCVLSGLARGSQGHVATLPPSCRPSERVIFDLLKSGGDARIDVLPDGRVYTIVGGFQSQIPWLSLDGITFPTQMTRQTGTLELTSGWVNYGHGYAGVHMYMNKMDAVANGPATLCVATGLVRSGAWGAIGQVGDECKPKDGRLVFSANNHEHSTRMDVAADGVIQYTGGAKNHGWVSLSNLLWTAHGGENLPLAQGWVPYAAGYRHPSIQRLGKTEGRQLCVLTGLIKNHSGWSNPVATLPAPCRPAKRRIFGVNTHVNSVRLDVLPSGEIHYINGKQHWDWVSLDGIHFIVPASAAAGAGGGASSAATISSTSMK